MSNNPSTTTKPVAFRLPLETLAVLERRLKGKRSRWASVGEYLKERVIYDISRRHGKR